MKHDSILEKCKEFFKEVISVSLFLKYVKQNLLNIDEVLNVRYFMQLTL